MTAPREWRDRAGVTCAAIAAAAGITGANPTRTVERYERGERVASAAVVDAVRAMSGGQVTRSDFEAARRDFVRRRGGNR